MYYKKLAVVFTLIVVAAVGVVIILSYNPAVASETPRPPEVDVPILNSTPESSNPVSPQELLAILSQKATAITSQPGWVFVRSTVVYDTDTENNGLLPNGQEIPLSQVNENWFHVNEDGLVFEGASTMFTLGGEIVQTGVFANNSSWNSATEEITYQAPFFLGDMSDLASLIQETIDTTGELPDITITEKNGVKIYTFTIRYKPEEPIVIADFNQAVTEIITVVSIDENTGFPVQYDQTMVLKDGTERSFYRTTIEIKTNVIPPDNIIQLIEERK